MYKFVGKSSSPSPSPSSTPSSVRSASTAARTVGAENSGPRQPRDDVSEVSLSDDDAIVSGSNRLGCLSSVTQGALNH